MITKIAQLDRKITIQRAVETESDAGQIRKTWATWRTCFAMVRENFGSENTQTGGIVAQTMVDFYVRYKTGLNHDMIIEYRGETFNILTVTEADYKGHFYRDRFQKITAVKKDTPTTQQF